MISKFDYNSEDVMKILNNPEYTDEQKKQLFDKYKNDLKVLRKKEIISRVNELAQKIPTITEEIYINFLKNYEDDNLSKPFEIIEKELKEFENEMTEKYNVYLESKKNEEKAETIETPEENIVPDVSANKKEEDNSMDDIFANNNVEDEEQISPSLVLGENSVLNEEPEILAKPLFEDNNEAKDVMPNSIPDTLGEKGNASAIIISIIAIIIGAVAMYTIIKMG